jgi:hypothetical protein
LETVHLCQRIFSLSTQIHCTSVVNKNGRILETKLRNDSPTAKLTSQELEMLYMQRTLQANMNKEFDEKLGTYTYTITERDSSIEFIFPCNREIVFVSATPKIAKNITKKILDVIKEFELSPRIEQFR